MTSQTRPRPRLKLGVRATPYVFAFYMSSIMALLMCSTIVAVNYGLSAGYIAQVFKAYVVAMPVDVPGH